MTAPDGAFGSAVAPRSAWAYYNRSALPQKSVAEQRAAADEKRAAELDPQYEAVVR